MWIYWQGVREEHNVHARELDFLVKDDLVRREVTMLFFQYSAPFKWPKPPSMNPKDILNGVIFEATLAPLSLKLVSSIHMGYDEPLQDETMVRIKVILWKTFLVGLKLIHVCYVYRFLRVVPTLLPVLNPAISHRRRHQRLKCEPVAPWGR